MIDGVDHPVEGEVAAGQAVAERAAVLVGVGAERAEHPLVVDPAAHLAAVARGPHVVGHPAVRVGPQRAAVGQLEAGPLEEVGRRSYADRDHDQVGLPRAAVPAHAGHPVAVELERR